MDPMEMLFEEEGVDERKQRRRSILRLVTFVLWAAVLLAVFASAAVNPSVVNIITAVVFVLLFAIINAQFLILYWMNHRGFRRIDAKLRGSAYISELGGLPNRNYLLSELRREMPRARSENVPFVLMVVSLETLDGVRERRGEDFADRALHQIVETLRRTVRHSDFVAHLGDGRFCILLVESTLRDALTCLKRLPGTVAVSDGRHMYDVPITVRLAEYDMEALYATDVLGDAEEARALQRAMPGRTDIRAA